MNKEHFELKPLKGFGLINFGMTIDEAKKHAEIYGGIKYEGTQHEEGTLEQAGEIMRSAGSSNEEIADMIESLREHVEYLKNKYVIYFENDFDLYFNNNKLGEIRLITEKTPVFFAGENLYDLPGEKAMRLVAEGVQENPYMKEGGAFFVKHSFVLGEFFSDMRAGYPIWTSPHQPRQRNVFMNDIEAKYDLEEAVLFKAI